MKNYLMLYLFAVLFASCAVQGGTPPEGFTSLFNGTDLTGWHGDNPHTTVKAKDRKASLETQAAPFASCWTVEDGVLVNNGEGPYATTDKEYGDYELLIEYVLVPGADSGIYLRGNPQVQIWDTTEAGKKWKHGAKNGSGGLWNNSKKHGGRMPVVHADRPIGEWNQMRIRQLGSRTWVWLNEQMVVDGVIMDNYFSRKKTPLPARGHIHLQTHGGEMRWRNIYIREIGPEEANKRLGELDTQDFVAMLNGQDFTGWEGTVDHYELHDGVVHSSAGGNIFTSAMYSDFTLKMDFKLSPAANNGLAIRYTGQGDPAYNGMCELQVLEDTAPKYDDLDARQYHGSAYGKAAATRGYQRAVNEWNYQVIRVKGATIQVELNGTPILDADLSTITEFMSSKYKAEIPDAGHLGFAGHGKGAYFRNLWLRDDS